MASTNFQETVTKIPGDWANDINRLHYTIFEDPQDLSDIKIVLDLGSISSQESSNVSISGGSINGAVIGNLAPSTGVFTTLRVLTQGTTNDSVVSKFLLDSSLSSLVSGLGSMSSQQSASVTISGGAINGTQIGNLVPSSGVFTTLRSNATPTVSTDVITKGYFEANLTQLPTFGTMASQNATAVAITGGTLNGVSIGNIAPATGTFVDITSQKVIGSRGQLLLDASSVASAGVLLSSSSSTTPDVILRVASGGNLDFRNSADNRIVRIKDAVRVLIGNNAGDDGSNLLQVYGNARFDNIVSINPPTIPTHLTTKQYVDGVKTTIEANYTQAIADSTAGLGSMSTQESVSVSITGGSIDGVAIGVTTPGVGRFTTLQTSQTPLANNDVVPKQYLDTAISALQSSLTSGLGTLSSQNANAVNISGGSLSGVTLSSSTAVLTSGSVSATPNANTDLVNKLYVDTQLTTQLNTKLSKSGGTLTGPLILAADPTLALEPATKQYVDQKTPTGLIEYYPSSSAPQGRLRANGAVVSRTTYNALFAKIGTSFGAGDGVTTFQLPTIPDLVTGTIFAYIVFN